MFRLAARSWNRLVGKVPLVAAKDGDQPAPDREDRRVWVRYPCNLETTCQSTHPTIPLRLSARVKDISRGGISLFMNCRFEPGAMLSIDLPSATGQTSTVLAYVVRSRSNRDGEWAVGCTFAIELSTEDLEHLGAPRINGPTPDQRSWDRFPCEAQATCRLVQHEAAAPQTAEVLNIAPDGIGLRLCSPVPIGALLSLDLYNHRGEAAFTIMASAVHLTNRGHDWILGCNFLRELSEQELRALV
jgi:hypothetical protein